MTVSSRHNLVTWSSLFVLTLGTVLEPHTVMYIISSRCEGSPTPLKKCTDFEIFRYNFKISLIFHKISLVKICILLIFYGHNILINSNTLLVQDYTMNIYEYLCRCLSIGDYEHHVTRACFS